ncbi:hypothetical protein P8452_30215 [Trifolium repens]|nr:hypothetical protein P8452_30215 [Trifolium repens]
MKMACIPDQECNNNKMHFPKDPPYRETLPWFCCASSPLLHLFPLLTLYPGVYVAGDHDDDAESLLLYTRNLVPGVQSPLDQDLVFSVQV